jgi:hypothetical protein
MPSASVRLLAARFLVTETTERRRSLSLRPTSLAHRNSLVEAGSVPSLAPAAILAIHRWVARRRAGSAAGGLASRSGQNGRMKGSHRRECPLTGQNSEGYTLVSTRHSPRQLPLHLYTGDRAGRAGVDRREGPIGGRPSPRALQRGPGSDTVMYRSAGTFRSV